MKDWQEQQEEEWDATRHICTYIHISYQKGGEALRAVADESWLVVDAEDRHDARDDEGVLSHVPNQVLEEKNGKGERLNGGTLWEDRIIQG